MAKAFQMGLVQLSKKLFLILLHSIRTYLITQFKDLFESGLQEQLPSIGIITYSKDAIISLAKNIPGTTDIVQGFPYWGESPH